MGYVTPEQVEKRLHELGKDRAPRITIDSIDARISRTDYYVFPNTTVTVCAITLINGFTVVGSSAAVSMENFDKGIGEDIAYTDAYSKIWQLEGYLLKELTSKYII